MLLSLPGTRHPAPLFAASPGSRGAEVLRFNAGPRAFAMGSAQAGLTGDVFSLVLNPGGLGFVEYREASFVQNTWVEGINHQSALCVIPSAVRGTWGAGLSRLSAGTITGYDASGVRAGNVKASDLVATAGWGAVFGGIGYGAAAKWIREDLDSVTASSYALDLGAQTRRTLDGTTLGLGLAVQNLGPGLKFDRETARLPTTVLAGISATRRVYGEPWSVALDASRPADDDKMHYALGTEVGALGLFALRFGYRFPNDLGSGLSFGFGVRAKAIRVDYAFLLLGDFGPTHRFGLTLRWGEPQDISRDRDRLRRAGEHKARGREYTRERRYLEAMEEFQKALDLDPLDKETLAEMRKAYDALH